MNSEMDDPFENAVLGASIESPPIEKSAPPVTKFTAKIYFLIIILGTLSGLGPLAIDMYLPTFPLIAKDYGTSIAEVQKTLAAYFVGLAIGQLFYGPAADRFGRKRPLYVGLVMFIVASIGCALATNVYALIALRFLQALGGCAEMVIARAVVRDRFEQRDAARVFSSLVLVMGLAPILAPLIGGWVSLHYGWRGIFWVLAAVAVMGLASVTFFLSESHPVERRRKQNVSEMLANYKMLFMDRVFTGNAIAGGLASAGMFAYIGGSPFVYMELFHVQPQYFGFFFGANAAGVITCSQINGWLVKHYEMRRILRLALLSSAISGTILLIITLTHLGGFYGILLPIFCFVASLGFIFPNTTALAMSPHGKIAGNASAVLGCMQFLISGAGGLIVSALHNGTALPMTGVMAFCGVSALLLNLYFFGLKFSTR